ncbi:MAG: tyrosinase family protein [Panacagrimonas sp.]
MNRRDLVKLSLFGPLGYLLANSAFAVDGVLPRENINAFSQSADKVAKLRQAVTTLAGRPNTDWSSWFNMAAIHMISPDDVADAKPPAAVSALYNQCHSDESLFFLWHRAYVWSMERLMQDAVGDPSFRLPYWDWYGSPSLPEIFRGKLLSDGKTENSLYREDRNPGVNKGNAIWIPRVTAGFRTPGNGDFTRFQDQLNGGEHGSIHVAIGTRTNMGSTLTAARDPIFWLHHANIDRLLPVWLKIDPKRKARTSYPTWLPARYRFPEPGGQVQTPTVDQLALNAAEALGYAYDDLSQPTVAAPATPPKPTLSAGSAGPTTGTSPMRISEKKSVKIGAGATVSLPLSGGNGAKMQSLATGVTTAGAFTSVTIVLEGIKLAKAAPGVLGYEVYLNLPSQPSSTAPFERHFLGPISLFALTHSMPGHEGMNHGSNQRFAATQMLKDQSKTDNFSSSSISVSIMPVLAPDAKEPAEPVIEIGNVSVEASSAPVE